MISLSISAWRSDIWKAVTGISLYNNEGLIKLFDKRIHDLYGGIL